MSDEDYITIIEKLKYERMQLVDENAKIRDGIREILFDIGTLHDGGYIKVKIIRERLEKLLEKE